MPLLTVSMPLVTEHAESLQLNGGVGGVEWGCEPPRKAGASGCSATLGSAPFFIHAAIVVVHVPWLMIPSEFHADAHFPAPA